MHTQSLDGVIKFQADHQHLPLHAQLGAHAGPLLAWRALFVHLGGIGQVAHRYDGAGFGNISTRVGSAGAPGERGFLVTGSQTGGRDCMALADLCHVRRYDVARNWVQSEGSTAPSSESLTHGTLYDLSSEIRCVIHAHLPTLWRAARALDLPITDPAAAYGTPQMAQAVVGLVDPAQPFKRNVFAMGGHEDGVVAFGPNLDVAGAALTEMMARARVLVYEREGRLCSAAQSSNL